MRRTHFAVALLTLFCGACGQADREPVMQAEDCSAYSQYEFLGISSFEGSSEWFRFADATPGSIPTIDPRVQGSSDVVPEPLPSRHCGVAESETPNGMRVISVGHNFYGSGYGEWQHNAAGSRAHGDGYAGISFWARAEPASEKQFMLGVDDGQTITLTPEKPDDLTTGKDLNGDGQIGPGDIVNGTSCRLPPPAALGQVVCYSGDVGGPTSSGARVPAADECGNSFHTRVTLTENWQLVLIPWHELVQWPCPNRLEGGINPDDIAKFEIKLIQGATYDFWVDNFAFYR